MKKEIHPNYHDVKFNCSCGNSFVVGSTLGQDAFHIEICSKCHPFYTGQQKVIASDRIQRFREKYKSVKATQDKSTAA